MLRFLSIRSLAVIDRLELEFEPGLNVLTGETGAGKSILVGAVGLLVGDRASSDLVRTGEPLAAVEAVFDHAGGELIIRREISAQSGRSRAFVNGDLTTTAALRELASGLVDLHGQHEHQSLLDPATHLDVLDAFAGLQRESRCVGEAFSRLTALRLERDALATSEREAASRAEFIEYQLQEIRRAAPKPGEDEELEAERQLLMNAERLQRLCAEAYTSLYDGDTAALPALANVWKRVGELATIDARFAPYVAAREAIKPQLEDLAFFLRTYGDDVDSSPARLQDVEDRLALLARLKKKHGPTLHDVLNAAAGLECDLHGIHHANERRDALAVECAEASRVFLQHAEALSRARRGAAVEFSRRLEASLADLAMPRTRCELRFPTGSGESGWSERGIDQAEFYLSPNVGEDLKPLARIASGGELSRIMLALKTLASTDEPGKTLIFDEVDAGIGGAAADIVGARLRALAERYQVLCITHLPQIAAYGTGHFRIVKTVKADRTSTAVMRLAARDREDELGRMIAGADVTDAVRASAREMLRRKRAAARGESKNKAKGESETRRDG